MDTPIPSEPTSKPSPREPVCHNNNDNDNWQISSTAKKLTVSHRYLNSKESCEKDSQTQASDNVISAAKGSSLHNLLAGEKIVAGVDIALDAGEKHSDKSTVHFSAI